MGCDECLCTNGTKPLQQSFQRPSPRKGSADTTGNRRKDSFGKRWFKKSYFRKDHFKKNNFEKGYIRRSYFRRHIIGVQANVWTTYMRADTILEHMLLPRLAALAERAWSDGEKDFTDFMTRLDRLVGFYDRDGYSLIV